MKIALTGASGFIGSYLKNYFPDFVIINRNDTEKEIFKKLKDVDLVFNLAGATILKRWSKNYKKVLFSSRIETTKKLVKVINKSNIKHFISTSAIGIYPDNAPCDEYCKITADDFLGKLAEVWEKEAKNCNKPTTIVRLGVVLSLIHI
jgi:NAD dependent epimerase/dehydratase family enzyme